MDLQLQGIHHLTAITARAQANLDFYTQTLGMRLVKKTVNQDDVRAYHLFYADGLASPGTDLTFFDWSTIPAEQRGSHSISRTGPASTVLIPLAGGPLALPHWASPTARSTSVMDVRYSTLKIQKVSALRWWLM